ncbi:hypothetical protein SSX86_016484 [Deinandra increscens subsp. villosa]|uniref:Isopropylmalate dehydrogenase-like domain-containing protein n=1 Tax=Deinandra increscens subsp. villosa TaxID=3103831 RepID=A0AAP0GX80_9ASTR
MLMSGTVFREPILCKNVPRIVPGWKKPICIGRHAFGDQYRATDAVIKGPGKLKMIFVPEGGETPMELDVYDFKGPGIALAMYNVDESIRAFVESSMAMALSKKWPLYLSTKNTILKKYDGRFKDIFQEVYEENWKEKFEEHSIWIWVSGPYDFIIGHYHLMGKHWKQRQPMGLAKLDNNERLADFVQKLETACVETVESGKMTKDLAILIHGPK